MDHPGRRAARGPWAVLKRRSWCGGFGVCVFGGLGVLEFRGLGFRKGFGVRALGGEFGKMLAISGAL